ncbi:unnamed protein product [Choristocarpus tenellus]
MEARIELLERRRREMRAQVRVKAAHEKLQMGFERACQMKWKEDGGKGDGRQHRPLSPTLDLDRWTPPGNLLDTTEDGGGGPRSAVRENSLRSSEVALGVDSSERWNMGDGVDELGRLGMEVEPLLPPPATWHTAGGRFGGWKRGRHEQEEWLEFVSRRVQSKVVGGVPRNKSGEIDGTGEGEDEGEGQHSRVELHRGKGDRSGAPAGIQRGGKSSLGVGTNNDLLAKSGQVEAIGAGDKWRRDTLVEEGCVQEMEERELRQKALAAMGLARKRQKSQVAGRQ